MPQPTQTAVHIDRPLTNISVAYIQRASNYVASRMFPVVPVSKQTDKYFVYTKNDWLRDEAQLRADATESAGSGYNLTTTSYSADVYAFHKDIGDQTHENADAPINLDTEAAEFVTQRMLLRMETQWCSDFFQAGVWGTDVTPSVIWSTYATSDPIEDIEAAKNVIQSTTGFMPNTLLLGYETYRRLRNHPDLIDRIKYTTAQTITPDLMARLFDVDRVMVASAIKATNNEGGTPAYAYTHGKHALLCYSATTPGLLQPSAGYVFSWTGVSGGFNEVIGTSKYRMDLRRADRVEAQMAWDFKVVAPDLGYFFNNVVA